MIAKKLPYLDTNIVSNLPVLNILTQRNDFPSSFMTPDQGKFRDRRPIALISAHIRMTDSRIANSNEKFIVRRNWYGNFFDLKKNYFRNLIKKTKFTSFLAFEKESDYGFKKKKKKKFYSVFGKY